MPGRSLEISVQPKIMVWARESIGLNVEEVSSKLKIGTDRVLQWEKGYGKPTLSILKKLSVLYKRPLAVFFLSVPPKESPLPTDFRILPGKEEELLFSKETRLAIRRARRLKTLAWELMQELELNTEVNVSKTNSSADSERIAQKERGEASISIEEQFKMHNQYEAFRKWRSYLESLNILVFQMKIPLNDARGFSLWEEDPPAIVVSESDSVAAKIFTLFHEYAHLMLRKTGICMLDKDVFLRESEFAEEKFCNSFAGNFLVPRAELESYLDRRLSRGDFNVLEDTSISQISNRFKVSKHVILRRLLTIDAVGLDDYQTKLNEWESKIPPKVAEEEKSYPRSMPKVCLRENGTFFTSLVFEARDRGIINNNELSDYLSIRLKYVDGVEALIRGTNE